LVGTPLNLPSGVAVRAKMQTEQAYENLFVLAVALKIYRLP